jgi:hypothetical protein
VQVLRVRDKEFLFFHSPFLFYLQQLFGLKIINLKIQKTLIHQLKVMDKKTVNKKVMILNQNRIANKMKIKKVKILLNQMKRKKKNLKILSKKMK